MASLKYAPASGNESRIFGYHIAEQTTTEDVEYTIDSGQSFGQSFTTGSSVNDKTIKYVKIKAYKVGTPTADLVIKIVNGNPGSSVLGTLTISQAELSTYPTIVEVEKALDTPLLVSTSSTYGIEVSTASASGNHYVIVASSTSVYAGGSVWANTGSGWTNAFPNSDLYFAVRSGAVWYVSDGALGHVLITDKDVSGGYDRIKCNITDPYGIEHTNIWVSEQSGSNSVEYTESGDSADKFRFYNMGIVDSGDTPLINMKQEWENWYYVSTSGNDSNTGKTPAVAWRTVGKGFNTLVAGENLKITGVFNENNLQFANNGTSSSPIYVYSDSYSIISGSYPLIMLSKQYIILDGLILDGVLNYTSPNAASNGKLLNCTIGMLGHWADVYLPNNWLVENCILNDSLVLVNGADSSIIRYNRIKKLLVYLTAGVNSIYWNRIKTKTVNKSQTWWAVTPGGKTVGNYWYGEEANDTDNDCYGFVNLNGVDVYNQIVALGVAYQNCKDSDNNSVTSTQSKLQVNVGGADKDVSIAGDSGYYPYNGDRDVYVHTTSDVQVLCILDPKLTDYTKFIVEGSAKITCKKNEW